MENESFFSKLTFGNVSLLFGKKIYMDLMQYVRVMLRYFR